MQPTGSSSEPVHMNASSEVSQSGSPSETELTPTSNFEGHTYTGLNDKVKAYIQNREKELANPATKKLREPERTPAPVSTESRAQTPMDRAVARRKFVIGMATVIALLAAIVLSALHMNDKVG